MMNLIKSHIDLLIFSMSVMIFFTVITLSARYKMRQEQLERIRTIATGTRKRIRLASVERAAPKIRTKIELKKVVVNFFKDYIVKLTDDKASNFRTLFERAGWSSLNAVLFYSCIKVIMTITFGIAAKLCIEYVHFFSKQTQLVQFFILGASILLGSQIFDILLKIKIYQRESLIKRDLSSALDLLAICTNAGLSIDRALEYVAEELGSSNPELCRELAITAIELNILPDRRSAFRNLPNRIDLPLIRAMATTLVQSEEQGTSISSTLKILSAEFREQKMMAIETRAAKLPAILTLPIILFTLPSLMIMIMGPTIINLVNEVSF